MGQYQDGVPTCEIGHWEPLHAGCPVCEPNGPCRDPFYEALIQTNLAGKLRRKAAAQTLAIFLLIAFAVLLTACTAPAVLSTPNSCVTLIPETWRAGVPGVPLPSNDTIGEWIAFGDGQTGKLDVANGRTADTIGIIERCEARDSAAVKRATRRWWKLF